MAKKPVEAKKPKISVEEQRTRAFLEHADQVPGIPPPKEQKRHSLTGDELGQLTKEGTTVRGVLGQGIEAPSQPANSPLKSPLPTDNIHRRQHPQKDSTRDERR